MATLIQVRRDIATNWTTINPILAQGEFGWDMSNGLLKIGDGVTAWNTLTYYSSGGASTTGAEGIVTYSSNPTTRADGSALEAGDIYYNTGDNSLYSYDGSGWSAIGGTGGSTVGTADSIRTYSIDPTTDSSGNPIAIGDMYYNTTDGVVYVYNGSEFVPVAQDSTSVVSYAADPTGTPVAGDVYYNTTENVLKVFDGTTWTDATGGGAAGSIPTSPTEPVGPSTAGDVYYNTTTNEQYVFDGTDWTPVDSGVADSLRSLSTEPTTDAQGNALAAGDVYYNTTDKVTYVYDGFEFKPQEGTASSFKTSPVAPASAVEGDTYYNTTTNEVMAYDGSAWVPVGADTNTTVTNLSFSNTTGDLTLVDSDGTTKITSIDGRYPTVAQVNTQISNTIQASVGFGDLNDVSVAAATNGQSVVYNGTAWVPATPFSGDYNDLINAPGGINSIDELGDVDTTTTPPIPGQILKWNGASWVPGNDATSGGGGLNADTLDGFDSTYFLDYNNFINTPPGSTDTVLTTSIFSTSTGDLTITDSAGSVYTTSLDGRYLLSGSLATVASTGDYNDLINKPTIPTDIAQLADATNLLVANIDDLGDVSTAGAISGHTLQFNGTTWVSAAPVTGPTTLVNLSDTIITTPLAGQYLSWNGAAWVNAALVHPAETVTTLGIAADVLTYTDEAGAATNITIPALGDPRYIGVSTGAPLTRADGSPTQYADFYFETATEKLMWNEGSSWLPVDSTTTNSSVAFDIATGDLTITDSRAGTVVANLDGRYITGASGSIPVVINDLNDVDTTTATPVSADVLTWDGAKWAPAAPAVTAETVTTLSLATNTLSYVDEAGNQTDLDLSIYLDDTNLARITSGTLDGTTGIATFTRDDATTFTVDMSALISDIDTVAELTDVDLTTTPQVDGDVLTWDATNSVWVPAAAGESIIQGTHVGQQLVWKGTDWQLTQNTANFMASAADTASFEAAYAGQYGLTTPLDPADLSALHFYNTTTNTIWFYDVNTTAWVDTAPTFTETVTTFTDNGNGTYTYTSEDGTVTTTAAPGAETVTTLIDNGDGTLTYTSENATATTFGTGANELTDLTDVVGTGPFTQGDVLTVNATGNFEFATPTAETVTTFVDNGDNTFTYTSENATATTVTVHPTVASLTDTDTTTAAPTDGQALVWNATNSVWQPASVGGSSLPTGSALGDRLIWDGTAWVTNPDQAYDIITYPTEAAATAALVSSTMGGGSDGRIYYNTTDKTLYTYDGSAWSAVGGGGNIPDGTAFGEILWWTGATWALSPNFASAGFEFDGYTGTFLTDQVSHRAVAIAQAVNAQVDMNKAYQTVDASVATTIVADTGTLTAGINKSTMLEIVVANGVTPAFGTMTWMSGSAPTLADGTHFVEVWTNGTAVYANYLAPSASSGGSGVYQAAAGDTGVTSYEVQSSSWDYEAGTGTQYTSITTRADGSALQPGDRLQATYFAGSDPAGTTNVYNFEWAIDTQGTFGWSRFAYLNEYGAVEANNFQSPASGSFGNQISFSNAVSTFPVAANVTMTVNAAAVPSGMVGTTTMIITVSNNAVITWPAAVKWAGGTAPTLANGVHIISFMTTDGGVNVYATASTDFA